MNQKRPAQQGAQKQPQDPYAKRGKALTSSVQRLRGWVGSDPSRTPELADALVEVTAHRLLGHGYAQAVADAQDAVRLAAQLLTANGPIGPYTAAADVARYLDAVVQVATIQVAAGQAEAAGRTVESLQPLQQQVRELGLQQPWPARTAVWALACRARAALAAGDVARANSCADAAQAALTASAEDRDPDAVYLALDVARLVSDCRWAAGRAQESLAFLRTAQERHEAAGAGRLREPGRLSPALAERLAEPLFGLHRDLADRLVASGELDLGLVTRRDLVALLRGLAPRLGDPARIQLASALADLARDLLGADRLDEAARAAEEAAGTGVDWSRAQPTRLLVHAVQAQVLTRTGRADDAVAALRPLLASAPADLPPAVRAVSLSALAGTLRVEGQVEEAASQEQRYQELVAALGGAGTPAAVLDRARGVLSLGPEPVTWSPLPADETYPVVAAAAPPPPVTAEPDSGAWLDEQRAEAHRAETARLEEAQREAGRREAERLAAEREAEEQAAAARSRAAREEQRQAERRAAAEEAERLERKRRREERLEQHRLEVERREAERAEAARAEFGPDETERRELERLQAELDALDRVEEAPAPAPAEDEPLVTPESPAEELVVPGEQEVAVPAPAGAPDEVPAPDEVALVQQAWEDARARGDRRAARAAVERLVELLRPRAQAEPDRYGEALLQALEGLASARLRGGDVFGSRAAAREARALRRS